MPYTRILLLLLAVGTLLALRPKPRPLPNVVVILADDLGLGDVRALNPEAKVQTPNLDRLARQGMTFTRAHTNSAVCTPTRYGLLTGRYCWRSRLKAQVLSSFDSTLIEPGRPTLATLLRRAGYRTACIGKWHLGLNWTRRDAARPLYATITNYVPTELNLDYAQPAPGVNKAGFDESLVIAGSLDMPPYCFIRNGRVEQLPTARLDDSPTIEDRQHWRRGDRSPDFQLSRVLDTFVQSGIEFIRRVVDSPGETRPFFLYLPLTSPHLPWVPTDAFKGKSGAGLYGDFVESTDAAVGRILDALDEQGLSQNTLVIFTSDNGAFWRPEDIARYGHRANGTLRGQKGDIHEGGHQVPFLVRWPGQIRPGSQSNRLVSTTDLFATLAQLTGQKLSPNEAEDSYDFSGAWTGRPAKTMAREALITHSLTGKFALQRGDWKLVPSLGSGGFTKPQNPPAGPGESPGQLYNLAEDPGETRNRYAERPDVVQALSTLLRQYQQQGFSRPVNATVTSRRSAGFQPEK